MLICVRFLRRSAGVHSEWMRFAGGESLSGFRFSSVLWLSVFGALGCSAESLHTTALQSKCEAAEDITLPPLNTEDRNDFDARIQWYKANAKPDVFRGASQTRVHHVHIAAPCGRVAARRIAIIPGVGETCGYWAEFIEHAFRRGFAVDCMDLTGQGQSEPLADKDSIHMNSFEQAAADVAYFLDKIVTAEGTSCFTPSTTVLAHSTGAALTLEAFAQKRGLQEKIQKVILSSPLLGLNLGEHVLRYIQNKPTKLLTGLFYYLRGLWDPTLLARDHTQDSDYESSFREEIQEAIDEGRIKGARLAFRTYLNELDPHIQRKGPTFGWVKQIRAGLQRLNNAYADREHPLKGLASPMALIHRDDFDDPVVSGRAQQRFCERVGNCTLIPQKIYHSFVTAEDEVFQDATDWSLEFAQREHQRTPAAAK